MANLDYEKNGQDLRGLTLNLVNNGQLTEERAKAVMVEAARDGISLVTYLVSKRIVSARQVAEASAGPLRVRTRSEQPPAACPPHR